MHTIKSNVQVLSYVVIAFLLTYGVLVNSNFPYLGIAVAWSVLTTAIYLSKKHVDAFVHATYALSMAVSFCFMWRANPLLTFFNGIAMIGLTSILSIVHDDERLPGLVRMLFSPVILFTRTMGTQIQYSAEVSADRVTTQLRKLKFQEAFISVVVTLVSLFIIIPLLAGSNPFFKNLVDESISLLNLMTVFEKIQSLKLTSWTLLQLGVFSFMLVAVPRLFGYLAGQVRGKSKTELVERNMLLPKLVISIVLAVFFATQLQLYVASDAQLLAVGSTPSQRTNEVFGQLSVVTGVVLGLLYFFCSHSLRERRLTWLLLIESVFLTVIASSSVYQYAFNFGFTFKRLWGIAVVCWLFAVLAVFARNYWQRRAGEYFLQSLLLLSATALVLVNIMNFDYLIAHVHQPRTGEGTDYAYMLYELSADARAERLLLNAFENQAQAATEPSALSYARFMKNILNERIVRQQEKFTSLDIRGLNLSEYVSYRQLTGYDASADLERIRALELQPAQLEAEASPTPSPLPTEK